MLITIFDYGAGNLHSLAKALEAPGVAVRVEPDPVRAADADALVLPGVGAFPQAAERLAPGRAAVREAIEGGLPTFGICLGMQLLFDESEEFGPVRGLGVLPGRVVRFLPAPALKVPHMGWNQLRVARRVPQLAGIESGTSVYFVHSYYPVPADPAVVATTTTYGPEFASSVAHENVFACQFHPEKSQRVGLRLLENFVGVVRGRPVG